ncbi:MAG TPA: hypothetical protein VKZ49_15950 [Polyangiaceae bacterium]|nr:hypothetical protein [Polyangiaceae bacterium]
MRNELLGMLVSLGPALGLAACGEPHASKSSAATGAQGGAGGEQVLQAPDSGGGGFAEPPCPRVMPNATCDASDVGLDCRYDHAQCQCSQVLEQQLQWMCAAVNPHCPAELPASGESCGDDAAEDTFCAYGGARCRCVGGSWECATCPAEEPEGACGGARGLDCAYGPTVCSCRGGSAPAWACTAAVSCPETPPDGPCAMVGRECRYDNASCLCDPSGRWLCFS